MLSFYFFINKANNGGLPCCIFFLKKSIQMERAILTTMAKVLLYFVLSKKVLLYLKMLLSDVGSENVEAEAARRA